MFDGAVKTSRTQALLWRNTGPLPRRCTVSLSSLRIVKKCGVFFQKIEGLSGIPGPEAYQIKKIEYAQRRRLRRNKFRSQKWSFPDLRVFIKPQRNESLPFKSTSFQIHSSKCSFKSAFFQTSIFKFYLLGSISALLLLTCSTSSFQKLVEKVRNHIKEVWLIFKKMNLVRWFWASFFWKKSVKHKRFFFDRQDQGW